MPRTVQFVKAPVAAVVFAVAIAAASGPALAGPPLLCHPFEIGSAPSLPWDGSRAFWQGRADYSLFNLVADTERLMTPDTPVIVRMETLRRAALYASADPAAAERLYARFESRMRQAGAGRAAALAIFDFAYLTETYRQVAELDQGLSEFRGRGPVLRRLIGTNDGYALMKKSLELRGDDPAMEFAAALTQGRRDAAAYRLHAEKARAGAGRDALLARNLNHIS